MIMKLLGLFVRHSAGVRCSCRVWVKLAADSCRRDATHDVQKLHTEASHHACANDANLHRLA
jgi:hypothetical protein